MYLSYKGSSKVVYLMPTLGLIHMKYGLFKKVAKLRGCSFENMSCRRLLFTVYIGRVVDSKHRKYYNPS